MLHRETGKLEGKGLGFRTLGLGFRVSDLGFRI